jgi:eukaryotic-like serine/threonine-protein kinase
LTLMANGQPRIGTRIGTTGYTPIEQFNRSPVLASDIYAVGAIGMQAMSGKYPHEIFFDKDRDIFAWQKVPNCYATDAFAIVLNRMLANSLDVRYLDATAALAALIPLQSIPVPNNPNPLPPPISPLASLTIKQQFRGRLSQEIFTFETAKLQQVQEQQVEIVKKPKWWVLREKEERYTKMVKAWKVKKTTNQSERFVEDFGAKLEMVYIPAGTFTMGAPTTEKGSGDDERPQHLVAVPEFYMGRYAVTQEQYLAVMGKNPARFQGAQLPVEQVSWDNAQEFCKKLSVKTGKKYQLPSEAMWEYACRAGTTTPFHFGEMITPELANFYDRDHFLASGAKLTGGAAIELRAKFASISVSSKYQTTAVGSFSANGFGLADMHGNVWEWCEDTFHKNYEGAPLDGSSWSGNGNTKLMRGGSWCGNPGSCRSALRHFYFTDNWFENVGFRVIYLQDS